MRWAMGKGVRRLGGERCQKSSVQAHPVPLCLASLGSIVLVVRLRLALRLLDSNQRCYVVPSVRSLVLLGGGHGKQEAGREVGCWTLRLERPAESSRPQRPKRRPQPSTAHLGSIKQQTLFWQTSSHSRRHHPPRHLKSPPTYQIARPTRLVARPRRLLERTSSPQPLPTRSLLPRPTRSVMKFEAFSCEVLCGGVALAEHQIKVDEAGRVATCYIESEEGQVSPPSPPPFHLAVAHLAMLTELVLSSALLGTMETGPLTLTSCRGDCELCPPRRREPGSSDTRLRSHRGGPQRKTHLSHLTETLCVHSHRKQFIVSAFLRK